MATEEKNGSNGNGEVEVVSLEEGEPKDSKEASSKPTMQVRKAASKDEKTGDRGAKEKALQAALAQIEKAHGKGAIMKMGESTKVKVDMISSGSISLDWALGIGGFPRGRIIEVFGPESSGKTTLAQHLIAEVQKLGGVAAFIDAEHALDPTYARKLGVDVDSLYISQPDYGEQALGIADTLISSGAVDIVVVDSVAALVPRSELEGDMGDPHVGLQARLMSQALRKLTGLISRTKTCAVFVNQIREKIGITFGNPETTPGGRALKFSASVRVEIRRTTSIKDGDAVIGNRTKVKVVKNKMAPPFKEAEFDIIFGEGISKVGEIVDLGAEYDILKKRGAFYYYKDESLGQGRENVKRFFKENPAVAGEVEMQVRSALGMIPAEG
jgi:recombination protein RecA